MSSQPRRGVTVPRLVLTLGVALVAGLMAAQVVPATGSSSGAVTTDPSGGATDDPLSDESGPIPSPDLSPSQMADLGAASATSDVIQVIGKGSVIAPKDALTWTDDVPPLRLLGAAVTVTFNPAISVDADLPSLAYDESEKTSPPYVTYKTHVVGSNIGSMTVFVDMDGNLVGIIPDSDPNSKISSQETVGTPTLPTHHED